jgi:hypothetical protein
MKTNRLAKFTSVLMIVIAVAACGKSKNNNQAVAPAPTANPYPYPNTPNGPYNNNQASTVEIYRSQVRCFNDRNVEVSCTGQVPQPNPGCIFEQLMFNGYSYSSVYCVQASYHY